jgi:hypothetical protein
MEREQNSLNDFDIKIIKSSEIKELKKHGQ